MKIYLLMVLIGTLLTAIRFTSVTEQQSKTPRRTNSASLVAAGAICGACARIVLRSIG